MPVVALAAASGIVPPRAVRLAATTNCRGNRIPHGRGANCVLARGGEVGVRGPGGQDLLDGRFHRGGRFLLPEGMKQRGQYGERICAMGLATPWPAMSGAAPPRLIETEAAYVSSPAGRTTNVEACRGQHANRAAQRGQLVAQDVAEHVAAQQHVEPPRIADQLHGSIVDVEVLQGNVGIVRADFADHSRQKTIEVRMLALSMEVTRRRRVAAIWKAACAIRSISARR